MSVQAQDIDEQQGDERLASGLRETAQRRAMLVRRFGTVPTSILRNLRHPSELRDLYIYQREAVKRQRSHTQRVQEKHVRLAAYGITGKASGNFAGRGTAGITIMPAELVYFFAAYYSQPGATYLDPFMGQGIQLQVAKRMGLHYRGYDVSREFVGYIKSILPNIDDGATTIQAELGDSRYPDRIPDECGDFGFTSPPYWDIEFYGDEQEQLGNGTYAEFLDGMEAVARAWLPKFKPGATFVVNVNDFRKAGVFYPYHADTVALMQRAGWTISDTWIIEGLVGGLARVFAVSFNWNKIAPKVHEYALVFKA